MHSENLQHSVESLVPESNMESGVQYRLEEITWRFGMHLNNIVGQEGRGENLKGSPILVLWKKNKNAIKEKVATLKLYLICIVCGQ